MITKITGNLSRVGDDQAVIEVDAFEYQVLIPEFARRQLQARVDQPISLHTIYYLDGNPAHGRLTPRLVGFLKEAEREFFELFCSVDGVGVRKALRAMVRPVQHVSLQHAETGLGAPIGDSLPPAHLLDCLQHPFLGNPGLGQDTGHGGVALA
ncbi:MAG: hypothetical protein JJ992_12995, partial [Planctomycetes bacterium]|nr:hypothetical protein [Planctomycetota bacterium]